MSRRSTLPLVFTAIGAFTLGCQTLLLREYLVGFEGNELGLAVFYSSWLFWIGVGSAFGLLLRRRLSNGRLFLPLVSLYPILVAIQLLSITLIRPIAGLESFELFPIDTLLLATALTNSPASVLTGLLFTTGCLFAASHSTNGPLGSSAGTSDSTSGAPGAGREASHPTTMASGAIAARLYAFEALGSFAGGVLVTVLLWNQVEPLTVFLAISAGLAACALVVSLTCRFRVSAVAAGLLLAASLGLLLTPAGRRAGDWLQDLNWQIAMPMAEPLDSLETPFQRVTIGRLANQVVFLADGAIVTSTAERDTQQLTAALLAAEAPGAQRILVLGMGMEGLVPHLLEYGPSHIDLVQVDEKYHRAVLPYYDEVVRQAFSDARVTTHFGDPRDFAASLATGPDRPAYDLILVHLPDPDTAYLNRFYTVDFYRELHGALAEDGVVATRVAAGENYAGTELMEYGRSVFASLDEVFAHVVVTPGELAWLFAADAPEAVTVDASVLQSRFAGLVERDPEIPEEVFQSLVPAERVESTRQAFAGGREQDRRALLNTDTRPIALLVNLMVLASQSGLKLGMTLKAFRTTGFLLLLVALGLAVLLRLYFRSTTRLSEGQALGFNGAVLLAGFGGTSMFASILLLVAFQNRFGLLFISVGLLSALFMLGLFGGGLAGVRWMRRQQGTRYLPVHLLILAVIGLCLGLPYLVELLAATDRWVAMVTYHGLFLLTGAVIGLGFPLAGYYFNLRSHDTGLVAGMLESVDHWGGALSAAVVGVLVLPVLGMHRGSILAATLLAALWILFAVEQLGQRTGLARQPWARPLANRLRRVERCHRSSRYRSAAFVATGVVAVVVISSNVLVAEREKLEELAKEQWVENPFQAVPGAPQEVRRVESPFVHYLSEDLEDPGHFEVFVESRTIAPDVRGFGGPINLMVSVRDDGRIQRIALLEHHETPAYLTGLDGFLGQLSGWPVERPVALGDGGIDAMTGATISSRAIATIVDQCRQRIAADILSQSTGPAEAGGPPIAFDERVIYVLALLAVGVLVAVKGKRVSRLGFLALNLALGGFWLNIQFSAWHVTQLFSWDYPTPAMLEMFLFLTGLLLLALALGQIHCGVLCPFGALQELLGQTGLARRPGIEADRRSRRVKFAVLVALLVAFFLSRSDSLLAFDPLQAVFTFDYTPLMIALLSLVLILSVFVYRFWCRYLCPVGAFWALFNKLTWARRWLEPRRYNRCDLGVRNQFDLDCIQCNRCVDGTLKATPAAVSKGRGDSPEKTAVAVDGVSPQLGRETDVLPIDGLTSGTVSGTANRQDAGSAHGAGDCENQPVRHAPSSRWLDRLLYAGVGAALVLGVLLIAGVGEPAPVAEPLQAERTGEEAVSAVTRGTPRTIQAEMFRRLFEEGELSEHEALFYRRVGEEGGQ